MADSPQNPYQYSGTQTTRALNPDSRTLILQLLGWLLPDSVGAIVLFLGLIVPNNSSYGAAKQMLGIGRGCGFAILLPLSIFAVSRQTEWLLNAIRLFCLAAAIAWLTAILTTELCLPLIGLCPEVWQWHGVWSTDFGSFRPFGQTAESHDEAG